MLVVKPTIYGTQKYIVSHMKLRLSLYNGFTLNDHHPQSTFASLTSLVSSSSSSCC